MFLGCPQSICSRAVYEFFLIPATGVGEAERLTEDMPDFDPYFSPNESNVAWLTQTSTDGPVGKWNIRGANADGSGMQWLTNNHNVNSKPEWSNDGDMIFLERLEFAVHNGFSIFRINPDGSGMQ